MGVDRVRLGPSLRGATREELEPEAPRPRVPSELVIDGRVYRLVEEPSPARPACPSDPTTTTAAPPSRFASRAPPVHLLTARELEIVTLVGAGRVNKEIGVALGISEWTVSTHLRRVYAKLGVDSRAAMVARCFGVAARRD